MILCSSRKSSITVDISTKNESCVNFESGTKYINFVPPRKAVIPTHIAIVYTKWNSFLRLKLKK